MPPDHMQAGISTEVGVHSVGDYDQRRPGITHEWKYACFERGDTTHFRKDCPVYLAKIKRFTANGKGEMDGKCEENF